MIQVNGLGKSYGKQRLFTDATFTIAPGERIGLIGRNGHGKSTLFKILLGEEDYDSGEIIIPRGHRIGHLSQHLKFKGKTSLDEASSALPHYNEGWAEVYKAELVLEGLGFSREQFEMAPQLLSGGYQVRLNLAKVLLGEPNLLLLDEPTNYLDVVSMRWLGRFLREWPHELMLITHDREFMDSVTTHTMMIHRERVRKGDGPTAKLVQQVLMEEEIHEKTRLNEAKRREVSERFIERFRAQASRAKAVQSRMKMLEKQEKLEKLSEIANLDFSFRAAPFPGKFLMHVEGLSFGYDAANPLISDLTFSVQKTDRIAVIGKNGRGKSTLLNLLAGELKPLAGKVERSPNLEIGYFGQTNVERLTPSRTIEEEIMAVNPEHSRTVARSICGAMMFEGDNAEKRISVLSGGEKSRVLLGKILVTPANLLLLDEPTNHLDMESVDSLVEAVGEFPGAVILVTHSEMILRALATRLVVFDRGQAELFEGTYDDFLERRGWADEGGPTNTGKKEQRKQRAEDRAKKKELEKEMKQIEDKISRFEGRAAELTQELIQLDPASDPAKFSQLSKEQHSIAKEIEKLFDQLERAHDGLRTEGGE